MSERSDSEKQQGVDPESRTLSEDDPHAAGGVSGQGREGVGPQEASPNIGEEGEPGQTTVPAMDDDAEAPSEVTPPEENL